MPGRSTWLLVLLLLAIGLAVWLLGGADPEASGVVERSDTSSAETSLRSAPRDPPKQDEGEKGDSPQVGDGARALRGSAPAGIRVDVRCAETGKPVSGASVLLVGDSTAARVVGVLLRGDVLARARTDEGGLATIDPPPGAFSSATRILASHPERVAAGVPCARAVYAYSIPLQRAASIEGQVEDFEGRLVSGVTVVARLPGEPRVDDHLVSDEPQAGRWMTRSGEDGTFVLRGLPPETQIYITAHGDGWAFNRAYHGLAERGRSLWSDSTGVRLRVEAVRAVLLRFIDGRTETPLNWHPDQLMVVGVGDAEFAKELDPGTSLARAFGETTWLQAGPRPQDPSLYVGVVHLAECAVPPERAELFAYWELGAGGVKSEVQLRRPGEIDEHAVPDVIRVPYDNEHASKRGTLVVRDVDVDPRVAWPEARFLTFSLPAPPRLHCDGRIAGRPGSDGSWVFENVPVKHDRLRYHVGDFVSLACEAELHAGKESEIRVSLGDVTGVVVDVRDSDDRRCFGYSLSVTGDGGRGYGLPMALTEPRFSSTQQEPGALPLSLAPGRYRLGAQHYGCGLQPGAEVVIVEPGKMKWVKIVLPRE